MIILFYASQFHNVLWILQFITIEANYSVPTFVFMQKIEEKQAL